MEKAITNSTGACKLARIPVGPDICHHGFAYTVHQTVQRNGLYSTGYGISHCNKHLKSVNGYYFT